MLNEKVCNTNLNIPLSYNFKNYEQTIEITSNLINITNKYPYTGFKISVEYDKIKDYYYNKFSSLIVDDSNIDIPYPPLYLHHNPINTNFYWKNVHEDYSLSTHCIGVKKNKNMNMEGAVNLVDTTLKNISFRLKWILYKSPNMCRPTTRMLFHIFDPRYSSCWSQYMVDVNYNLQVAKGKILGSGLLNFGWIHTQRSISKSIFLFRGFPKFIQCKKKKCTNNTLYLKNIIEARQIERLALLETNLVCSEVNENISDFVFYKNGNYYDKHGYMTCKKWRFNLGEEYSILVINHPYFNKGKYMKQETNVFMYLDIFDNRFVNDSITTPMELVNIY